MTAFHPTLRAAAGLSMLVILASCGGGGGGGGGGNPPPPADLSILTTTLADGVVGVPYNQTLRVSGGTGATSFTVTAGDLPAGLVLEAATGVISGTPAGPVGAADFTVTVADSSSPPQDDAQDFSIAINATSLGRNDSIADATPLGNGTIGASISPSGDPAALLDPDEDYYAITTTATSTITIDIDAQVLGSPLDSVIEVLNSSGAQLNTCGSPSFNAECANDDEQLGVDLDSFLQVQVNGATTVYVHVLDWGMDARPDKLYNLAISGIN
ncbi:MAG TPA: Ig domain-containing protein [Steroidobacteraceae bacterium]|jgi:hypothetical protein|nr:Ig domain-containing protein [Steroidobacteraceae bacterium]